jgi:ribosomal protein L15
VVFYSGKLPIMGRFPKMGRCIISYQEVLCSLLNVNHQEDEAILSNHSINSQLLRTLVLTGRLCFGAL